MLKAKWTPVLIAIAWAVGTAALGAALTPLTPWYRGLERPWFQPPDWAFGPAWTLIFALSAFGFVRAWRAGAGRLLVVLFVVNGLLNAGWSLLFFTLQRPDWAMIEVVPLWLSILAMILEARRHDRRAAQLIAPYLAWVTFAACLNWAIIRLNAPFG
ncbi:MAG: tryptophan-rich sensory protein [Roseococcus sp.]|nr:tryptophan-rich sensory protein [Roseococcus sp.]